MIFNKDSIGTLLQAVSSRVFMFLRSTTGAISGLGKPARLLLVAATSLLMLVAIFWVVDKVILFFLTQHYVDEVAGVFDLNDHLRTALLLATFLVAAFFAQYIWSFSRKRRMIGIAGIAAMLIANSFALWYGTRDQYFDASGESIKCYVLTRDGTITYGEHPGIDPVTGRQCREINPKILERLKQYEAGKRPQRITVADPVFFDPRSGEPIVWYSITKDRVIEIFDLMGFNPDTGEELSPTTRDVAAEWKRRAPKLIPDPEKYVFFDPRNGEARAWYWLSADGRYEFYDSPGFRPQTGDKLQIVTREVHTRWEELNGVKAPNRVQITNDTVFFDPVTGNPLLWYWRRDKGVYEFFDGSGFHPQNGEPLKTFTKDAQTQYQQEIAANQSEQGPKTPAKAPNRVQITNDTVFFDLVTGNPLLWYWRRDKGVYEFFDGSGFHPQNGERLKSFTKDSLTQYQQEIDDKTKQLKTEQEGIKAEQEAEKTRQREQQQKEQADQLKRSQELQRATEAAGRCDELAANPSDARKVGAGVAYGDLRPLAADAVAACELAANQNPNELRFKYQLARALELTGDGAVRMKNRERAFEIHKVLVKAKYPAAFDNLGSMYIWDKKDFATAVHLFREGVQRGDSDSMVSLADLIKGGQVMPEGPNEYPLNLYKRAAELGNPNGSRAADEIQRQHVQESRQQQMMMQGLGAIMRNIR